MSEGGKLGFQEGSTPVMEQVIWFHDYIMIVLILVMVLVGWVLGSAISNSFVNRFLLENQVVEVLWTVLPAVVLLFIAFPSLRLLYMMDEVHQPFLTLKAIGHQWYWSYEYTDFKEMSFDSYMILEKDLQKSGFRSLDVDHRAAIPFLTQTRVLVTSADVIHSWALPSLGVKVDAVPGRLNQVSIFCTHSGVYFGQCSEICGANHSFMPVVVESIPSKKFLAWVLKMS